MTEGANGVSSAAVTDCNDRNKIGFSDSMIHGESSDDDERSNGAMPSRPPPIGIPRNVTVIKSAHGFGFNVRGQVSEGGQMKAISGELYAPMQQISYVLKGGPAEIAGVKEGDRIIEVNGTTAEGLSHHAVVDLIKSREDKVTMIIISVTHDEASRLDEEFNHVPSYDITERRTVYITIPDWRRIYSKGETYVTYNIYLSGKFLISRRFSEFYNLNKILKNSFLDFKMPKLPSRRMIKLTDAQMDERRVGLEKYLELVCSAPIIYQSHLIKDFINSETFRHPTSNLPPKVDLQLKVLLPEQNILAITIERAWTTDIVLGAIIENLALAKKFSEYFALFEIMEQDFFRKLRVTEFPHQVYINTYNQFNKTSLAFRKWIFSVPRELSLCENNNVFAFIYSQVREDINKGRLKLDINIRDLETLHDDGRRTDYMNLVRGTPFYLDIKFLPCLCESRKEGKVILSIGYDSVRLIACDQFGKEETTHPTVGLKWEEIGEHTADAEETSFRFRMLRKNKSAKLISISSKYFMYMDECFSRVLEEKEMNNDWEETDTQEIRLQALKKKAESSVKTLSVDKKISPNTDTQHEIQPTNGDNPEMTTSNNEDGL